MITSAENRSWPGDVPVSSLADAGLPVASVIRTAKIATIEADDAVKLRQWLDAHPDDRKGAKDKIVKSNRTDNESAKMATSKGVIQGYVGVAAVDAKHQIIVEAQAHGTGSEQALLLPVIDATATLRTDQTLITAVPRGFPSVTPDTTPMPTSPPWVTATPRP